MSSLATQTSFMVFLKAPFLSLFYFLGKCYSWVKLYLFPFLCNISSNYYYYHQSLTYESVSPHLICYTHTLPNELKSWMSSNFILLNNTRTGVILFWLDLNFYKHFNNMIKSPIKPPVKTGTFTKSDIHASVSSYLH